MSRPIPVMVVCPSKPAKMWGGPAIVSVIDLIDKFSRPTANMFPSIVISPINSNETLVLNSSVVYNLPSKW